MTDLESPSPLTEAEPQPAPPLRQRRLWKWLIILAATAGIAMIAGCVVLSLFIEAERDTTPAGVLQAARNITDITLPDGYEGEIAESVRSPLFLVRRTVFRHSSGKGVLSVVEMKFFVGNPQQAEEAVRKNLDQLVKDMRQIAPDEESKRPLTIRGEPAEFQVRSGPDALSSTKLHEIRGTFRGKEGIAELWWQAEDSIIDAAAIDRLLESLQ